MNDFEIAKEIQENAFTSAIEDANWTFRDCTDYNVKFDNCEKHAMDYIKKNCMFSDDVLPSFYARIHEHYAFIKATSDPNWTLKKHGVKHYTWFEPEELPEIPWLCSGLGLRPGAIHLLCAFSNVGKTFFAASLGVCVARGMKLFENIEIERPGRVVHIDWEQGDEDTRLYYWRILNGYNLKGFDNIDHLSMPDWNLTTPEAEKNLTAILTEEPTQLCIIDCLGAAIEGEDIIDERIGKYISMLNRVSIKTNCTIMLLHHTPKDTGKGKNKTKTVKGSGAIISRAGGSIHLDKSDTSDEITLELGKRRMTRPCNLRFSVEDSGVFSNRIKNYTGLFLKPTALAAAQPKERDSKLVMLEVIKKNPGLNSTKLRAESGLGSKADELADTLHKEEWITILPGEKRSKLHTITPLGEEQLATDKVATDGYGPTSFAMRK